MAGRETRNAFCTGRWTHMKMTRLAIIATFAVAIGSGEAFAAGSGLPLYPGAVAAPPIRTGKLCGHALTETSYNIGQTAINTVADWYAARIPGAVRWSSNQDSEMDAVVFDPNGARGVKAEHVVNNAHDLAQYKAKGFTPQNQVVFVTYSPAIKSASLQLLKAYYTGAPGALAEMKAKCATF
jgi:hypothetical protein